MKKWIKITVPTVVLFGFLLGGVKSDDKPVVQLLKPYGKVQGHTLKTATGKDYYAFQEIPYALAPVGNHRFQVPKKHNDWHNTLDTTKNTKICMQTLIKNPLNLNITEDCLYLNIYTPKLPQNLKHDSNLLPVLLWVHPGDFISGAGIYQYWGPQYFIEYEIIVVTMNYRLGPFGFLYAGNETIPGNLGLRDQLFVFDWLMDNVQQFGGNRLNIAIVGQGSGAASVSYHLINSRARDDVFSCAIMQSGSSLAPYYYQSEPKKYAFQLGKKIYSRFNSDDAQDLRDLLIPASAEDILKFGEEIMKEAQQNLFSSNSVWLPVVEGYFEKNGYLQWEQLKAYSEGTIRISPFMIGYTSEEMASLASFKNLTDIADIFDNNPSLLVSEELSISIDRKELGQKIKSVYTEKSFKEDTAAFVKYFSDRIRIPNLKQAYNSSWYNLNLIYQFSYKGDLAGATNVSDTNGVGHGAELKYMWDDGTNSDPSKFSKNDKVMQQKLLTLWTNFMKTQNVTPTADPILDNVIWHYISENTIEYLNIDTKMEINNDSEVFNYINTIIDQYITEPLTIYF